mmetsp:Transcript_38640/g.78811  ORF Transcript_38640/g.78811 Transcript_38640/m.78811 type:complete len:86 (+) Transcript_38640:579-836(+)
MALQGGHHVAVKYKMDFELIIRNFSTALSSLRVTTDIDRKMAFNPLERLQMPEREGTLSRLKTVAAVSVMVERAGDGLLDGELTS